MPSWPFLPLDVAKLYTLSGCCNYTKRPPGDHKKCADDETRLPSVGHC